MLRGNFRNGAGTDKPAICFAMIVGFTPLIIPYNWHERLCRQVSCQYSHY
ncbi:MAG: hypothetical protein ACE5D4_01365 [Thermodesulfobacteriota bacterium]